MRLKFYTQACRLIHKGRLARTKLAGFIEIFYLRNSTEKKFDFINPIPSHVFKNASQSDILNLSKFKSDLQNIILQMDEINKLDPFSVALVKRHEKFLHEAGIILFRIKNFEN